MSFDVCIYPQGNTAKEVSYSISGFCAMLKLTCALWKDGSGYYFIDLRALPSQPSRLPDLIEALQDAKKVGDEWVELHKPKTVVLTDSRKAYADELISKMGSCWIPSSQWEFDPNKDTYLRRGWNATYGGALPWLSVTISHDHIEVYSGSDCEALRGLCVRMPWSSVEGKSDE